MIVQQILKKRKKKHNKTGKEKEELADLRLN